MLASAHGVELGQLGLRALLTGGSGADVFQWMERTRAAALLAVQRAPVHGFEEELARLRALQGEMRLAGGGTPEQVDRQAELEEGLRRQTWAATASSAATHQAASLREVRDLLAGRVLVEYGLLDGQVFAVVVTERRVTMTTLAPVAAVREEIEKLLFLLRMLSRRTAAARDLLPLARQRLDRLRELLTDDLRLPADTEVVLVPVGVLQRVPWSALHDGPVSLTPSAAFWVRACRQQAPEGDRVMLAAGPGLAAAAAEVERLGELHRDSLVLMPPQSTVATVASALSGAGLAHFACHGEVRADNPMFSGLLLSDGSLTVHELEFRGVAPHRVVLAACEAAADVSYPGGEMLGFVSALLARGTAGIVASIVLVPDAAASNLMVGLHERVRRESFAVALHAARGALDTEDASEFVNWCGFTSFGAA